MTWERDKSGDTVSIATTILVYSASGELSPFTDVRIARAIFASQTAGTHRGSSPGAGKQAQVACGLIEEFISRVLDWLLQLTIVGVSLGFVADSPQRQRSAQQHRGGRGQEISCRMCW